MMIVVDGEYIWVLRVYSIYKINKLIIEIF